MSDINHPSDDGAGAVNDLWADAFGEQQAAAKTSGDGAFITQEADDSGGSLQDINLIMDIPVKLTVELGRTRMTIKELLRLTQGSVVADKYGVRITDIITPSERMRRLSREGDENPKQYCRRGQRAAVRVAAGGGQRRAGGDRDADSARRMAAPAPWPGAKMRRRSRTAYQQQP